MTFILRLIGIITVACIGGGSDPCNTRPYGLSVYVADGRSTHSPCNTNEVTPVHNPYIRVRSAVSGHWPGRTSCSDGTPCWLYPLFQDDVIRIDGVIDSAEGMKKAFEPTPIIQWSTWIPDKLAADAIEKSLATLMITAGTVYTESFDNGMIHTIGEFPVKTNTVRIVASGTNRYLIVPANSTVDILNMPRAVAEGLPESSVHHAAVEHFYLHYTLAATKPEECCGPKPELRLKNADGEPVTGSIACSNSLYP